MNPDVALKMPLGKILFYSDAMAVLKGDVLPERLLPSKDKEMMEYIEANSEEIENALKEVAENFDIETLGMWNKDEHS